MLPSSSFIQVQTNDFDQGHEYAQLACGTQVGAVVTFVGRVRDFSADTVKKLYLEHYPGMTESVLQQIASRAHSRWPLQQSRIIHRVGLLQPADQIVFVGVSAAHRQAAFSACAFIMDLLKTEAPFWKKEGDRWVDAKDSDEQAAQGWHDKS